MREAGERGRDQDEEEKGKEKTTERRKGTKEGKETTVPRVLKKRWLDG
jgi:hypothetical protein